MEKFITAFDLWYNEHADDYTSYARMIDDFVFSHAKNIFEYSAMYTILEDAFSEVLAMERGE